MQNKGRRLASAMRVVLWGGASPKLTWQQSGGGAVSECVQAGLGLFSSHLFEMETV